MTKLIIFIALLTALNITFFSIGYMLGYRKACRYHETQQTPEYVEQYLIDHKE